MADKTIEWKSRGADRIVEDARRILEAEKNLSAEEKKLASLVKKLTKEHEDAAKKQADAAEKRASAIKKSVAGVAAAVVAATAVSVREFASQEAALGRLQRSFSNTNAGLGDYAKAVDQIRQRSGTLGVDFQEQADALSQLADASGSATKATEDLALAVNISAVEHIDLSQAVEYLRKARDGEISELVNLNGLNRDQIDALNKETDSAKRTEKAIKALTVAYKDGAKETAGTEEKLKAWKETADLALGVAGKLAVKLTDGLAAGFARVAKEATGADLSLKGVNTSLSRMDKFIENANVADVLAVIAGGEFEDKQAAIDAVIRLANARAAGKGTGKGTFSGQGNTVAEVPEPDFVAKGQKRSKKAKDRDPNRGSDAMTGKDAPSDAELIQIIEAAGEERNEREAWFAQQRIERAREEAEEKKRIEDEQLAFSRKLQADQDAWSAAAAERRQQAQQAQLSAAMAGAEAIAGLAGNFIKDEGAKAVIEGGMEVARAIAAGAAGNIPGAIGHGAAAAQFFAVAAQAGQGGATSKMKGGGGAGKGSGSAPPRTPETERRRATAFGEGIGANGAPASINVTVVQNSIAKPTPREAAVVADSAGRALALRLQRSRGGR